MKNTDELTELNREIEELRIQRSMIQLRLREKLERRAELLAIDARR